MALNERNQAFDGKQQVQQQIAELLSKFDAGLHDEDSDVSLTRNLASTVNIKRPSVR